MANRLLSVLFLGFHDEKNREISKFQKKKKVNQMWTGRVCEWPGENGVPGLEKK